MCTKERAIVNEAWERYGRKNMRIQKTKDKQLKSYIMIKGKKNLEQPTPKSTYQKAKYQEVPDVQLVYKKCTYHEIKKKK